MAHFKLSVVLCMLLSMLLINTEAISKTDFPNTSLGSITPMNMSRVTNDPPVAVCQDVTLQLDDTGEATLTADEISSTDTSLCPDLDFSIDKTVFACNDVGGAGVDVVLTVTDDNGNESTCAAVVTVEDNIPPTLTCPAAVTVMCIEEVPDQLTTLAQLVFMGIASDNCGLDAASFMVNDVSDGMSCPETITRTYSVSDINGNGPVTCDQIIVVNDIELPVITRPLDITVDCSVDISDPLNTGGFPTSLVDNCTSSLFLLSTQTFTDDDPMDITDCGDRVVSRTWSVTDECGNIGQAIQLITVEDNQAPDLSSVIPPIIPDVECSDFPNNLPVQPAWNTLPGNPTDNCSGVTLSVSQSIPTAVSCDLAGTEVSYFYVGTDHCGNADSIEVKFLILPDTEVPVLDAASVDEIADINCQDPLPDPQDTDEFIVTDNCTDRSDITFLFNTTFPDGQDACIGYRVRYVWRPVDACGNRGDNVVRFFNVLPDMDAPVFDCPLVDITVGTEANECFGFFTPKPPFVSDACSEPIITSLFSSDLTGPADINGQYQLETGIYTIEWQAQDLCGNITATGNSNCVQTINVIDSQAPTAVCKNQRVILGYQGTASLNAVDVLSGKDNCPDDLTFELVRMENNCMMPDDLIEGDEVTFCCEDIGLTLMVMGVVTDAVGNSNSCMFEVDVIDNLTPIIDRCPSNVTVNCDIVLGDYSQFGTIVLDPATPQTHILGQDINGVDIEVIDGVAVENCDPITITTSVDDSNLVCNMGMVIRTITVTDPSGNSSSCDQWITIVDDSPLAMADITFPEDITIMNTCPFDPMHNDIIEPIFDNTGCTDAFIDFNDKIFDHPVSGCQLVERTWIVIDWCQMDADNNPVQFTDIQFISLKNTNAPTLDCAPVEVFINTQECSVSMTHTLSANDDCTAESDLIYSYTISNSEGSILGTGNTSTVTANLSNGVFTVTWNVDDRCGNIATCEQTVNVIDNKAPSPICISFINTSLDTMVGMPEFPMAEIWAKDFIQKGQDNCDADEDLLHTFDAAGLEMSMRFDCNNFGQIPLTVYTFDSQGNSTSCVVELGVQDVKGLCDDFVTEEPTERVVNCTEDQICLEITHENIDNILALQTGIEWDENQLEYVGINDGLLAFYHPSTVVDINASRGSIILSWVAPNGVPETMVDTALFEICFNVLTDLDDDFRVGFPESHYFMTSLVNENIEQIDLCMNDGGINMLNPTVNCESPISMLTIENINAACEEGTVNEEPEDATGTIVNCGEEQVCLSVTNENVDNILALQTGIEWDETQLEFMGINDGLLVFDPPASIIDINAVRGSIIISWANADGTPLSDLDGTLFEICFNVIGDLDKDMEVSFPSSHYFMTSLIDEAVQEVELCMQGGGINLSNPVLDCGLTPILKIEELQATCAEGTATSASFVSITGQVNTEGQEMIEDAEVRLYKNTNDFKQMTDDNGTYAFPNVVSYVDYMISPVKGGDYLEGISTIDLVMIQKHILGMNPLDSPYKVIAADVDNSESVSASDIIALRKLILGITDDLPNGEVWKFVDSSHQFGNLYRPWPYPATVEMDDLDHDAEEMNFIAVKTGDVNSSATPNAKSKDDTKNYSQVKLKVTDLELVDQGTYRVSVKLDQTVSILAMQMELELGNNANFIGLEEALLPVEEKHFNQMDNKLRISFDQEHSSYLSKGATLFYIYLSAQAKPEEISLAKTTFFKSEIYDENLAVKSIALEVEKEKFTKQELKGYNIPNPFKNETYLQFRSEAQEDYTVYIYNSIGVLIYKTRGKTTIGKNEVLITKEHLENNTGVYFFRVDLDKEVVTGKMILIK